MSPAEMRKFIHACRGKFKAKPGDNKPFAEWVADSKREEKLEGRNRV